MPNSQQVTSVPSEDHAIGASGGAPAASPRNTTGDEMESLEPAGLTVVPIDENNRAIFDRLVQCYECEFSSITEKQPDPDGLFPLDTHLDDSHKGFLSYFGDMPAGFNLIALKGNNRYEVCEFFVVPVFRKRGIGYHIAAAIFDLYPGEWEIKQVAGADGAKSSGGEPLAGTLATATGKMFLPIPTGGA